LAAVSAVLLLNLYLSVTLISFNPLYLGADVTRDAWRALTFINSGHFTHLYSIFFESDLFCFAFVPFLLVFKNTLLALQVSSVTLCALTVLIYYIFIRRKYGLLPAFGVGCVYATSPLLLSNYCMNPDQSVCLFISIILALETMNSKYAGPAAMALGGFFTSLHPYFLFPFSAYFLSKYFYKWPIDINREKIKAAIKYLALFAAGMSPLALKYLSPTAPGLQEIAKWYDRFRQSNTDNIWNILPAMKNMIVQFSWSLGSFTIDGPAHSKAVLFGFVFAVWAVSCCVGMFFRRSRQWILCLFTGLLFSACVISPDGFGMRHMLAMLPFYWIFLAPIVLHFSARTFKIIFLAFMIAVSVFQVNICRHYVKNDASMAVAEINSMEYFVSTLKLSEKKYLYIHSFDANLFYGLKYFLPQKDIRQFGAMSGFPYDTGLLIVCGASQSEAEQEKGQYNIFGTFKTVGVAHYYLMIQKH